MFVMMLNDITWRILECHTGYKLTVLNCSGPLFHWDIGYVKNCVRPLLTHTNLIFPQRVGESNGLNAFVMANLHIYVVYWHFGYQPICTQFTFKYLQYYISIIYR